MKSYLLVCVSRCPVGRGDAPSLTLWSCVLPRQFERNDFLSVRSPGSLEKGPKPTSVEIKFLLLSSISLDQVSAKRYQRCRDLNMSSVLSTVLWH